MLLNIAGVAQYRLVADSIYVIFSQLLLYLFLPWASTVRNSFFFLIHRDLEFYLPFLLHLPFPHPLSFQMIYTCHAIRYVPTFQEAMAIYTQIS